MRRAHRSLSAALGALTFGLAVPIAVQAQETEPQPEAAKQEAQQQAPENAMPEMGAEEAQTRPSAETGDLVAVARAEGNLTTFLDIVEEAGLTSELSTGGPYTIFAPTDEAFAAAEATGSGSADAAELRRLVRTHITVGDWTSTELTNASEITNLLADDLALQRQPESGTPGALEVAGAVVVKADIDASNGVIHQIDSVLAASPPPSAEASAGMMEQDAEMEPPASESTSSVPESADPDAAEAGSGD